MAIEISGNWNQGFAFDIHTLSSAYVGVDESGRKRWDSTRSDMGQLVYELKYHSDRTALPKIVALLDKMKGIESMDGIVPIPPSMPNRRFQPVLEIARALGQRRGVPVIEDALLKTGAGAQLKNVEDPDERRDLLEKSLALSSNIGVQGRNILLIDDLYRSGVTLSVATDVLLNQGGAKKVNVLTMTKTRSNR